MSTAAAMFHLPTFPSSYRVRTSNKVMDTPEQQNLEAHRTMKHKSSLELLTVGFEIYTRIAFTVIHVNRIS